ncbi:MAG: DUF4252 domain-containing protein [Bacteroidota bacterium]
MKKIFFIISLVFLTSCATQTSFNDFYQDNQKESDFSMGLNASIVRTFLSDEDFEEVKPLLKKAKHVRILVFTEDTQKMTSKFNKFIKRSDFENLISIKDDDDKVKIYALEQKNSIKEIVLDINSGDEMVLLGLKTNLKEEDLHKLIEDNDITLN